MNIDYNSIRKKYFENGGYSEVPELITNDSKRMMKCAYEIIQNGNYLRREKDGFIKTSDGKHGLQISNMLLLYFLEPYSKILGKNLVPTYSYTRTYFKGSNLPRHSDRPACQYSMTLNVGSSSQEPWPFWCHSKIKDGAKPQEIHNEMYVPIVYMGERVSHWREELQKDHSTHIFMHYVDGDDPNYREEWYDGKKFIV